MEDRLIDKLKTDKVQKMRRPLIIMNAEDLKDLIDNRIGVKESTPRYCDVPIKGSELIMRGEFFVIDQFNSIR